MRRLLPAAIARLRRATDGFIAFELVIMVPVFVLAIVVTFTAFDMYRLAARDAKAAIAVADALSRETLNITPDELATLGQLHAALTRTDGRQAVRIAVVDSNRRGRFRVRWTRKTGTPGYTLPPLNRSTLAEHIPPLARGEAVILVQTFTEFTPFTGKGFSLTEFTNAAVMRPRNAPQLCWSTDSRRSRDRTC